MKLEDMIDDEENQINALNHMINESTSRIKNSELNGQTRVNHATNVHSKLTEEFSRMRINLQKIGFQVEKESSELGNRRIDIQNSKFEFDDLVKKISKIENSVHGESDNINQEFNVTQKELQKQHQKLFDEEKTLLFLIQEEEQKILELEKIQKNMIQKIESSLNSAMRNN